MVPEVVGNRVFFISNLSGRLSLYAMNHGGSVPEPLLPPQIALQNPHILDTGSFKVLPGLGKILVTIDNDGDEKYQPCFIPITGGFPEPAFGDQLVDHRVHTLRVDEDTDQVYLFAESLKESMITTYRGNLKTRKLVKLAESPYGMFAAAYSADHSLVALAEGYTVGDIALYLWSGGKKLKLLYGKPLDEREPGEDVPLNGLGPGCFVNKDKALLLSTTLFDDKVGFGLIELDKPGAIKPVKVTGKRHKGIGEMTGFELMKRSRYIVSYNIDGCSWIYEAEFDLKSLTMKLDKVICGQRELADGVIESHSYDKKGDRHAMSFSTATSPTQIYTAEGPSRKLIRHTSEKILGLPANVLSPGEDASYTSHDGLRVSARLYLPAKSLGFKGPRPLVYYIHGGPQGQERPDFAWFSMPLIQFLTLRGFAVFVPNVRGSTGYGLAYTKHVDHDWGGQDRLDHVHAMTKVLPKDKRIDVKRAGVTGRSYGGYMTLILASQHPELWKASVDMFGPYDLTKFMERIPETWKPYFKIVLGDPEKPEDLKFLRERSPATHIDKVKAPMLVIQGANDPRVVEAESRDVVAQLQKKGKQAEILVFADEGHDVLKYENRVTCYNAITDFFTKYLKP
jgi:pimeloyl-ACP methyl ester carboxylesterase